jgi:hypothetical protein
LEGLPASQAQGPVIGAAVEAELARLLAAEGLDARGSRSEPYLPAGHVQLRSQSDSRGLGRQIGGVVYQILNPTEPATAIENISHDRLRH